MKKIGCFMLAFWFMVAPVQAEDELAAHAQSAYLMEYETGESLFEKNSEEKMYPASMTKMMSLILVYEALNTQTLKLDEVLTISEKAASMGGSQVFLQQNEKMSVKDLLKAVCIASANDAMVALAERLSGSVSEFVGKMNEKSKELKLKNSHFINVTGLHDEHHYSCAKDMAIIAQKLIQVGGENLLAVTSTYDAYIREDTKNPFWLVNTNKLVKYGEGVDGLKTGFTQEAMSCVTVTAYRNNIRLIGVVMHEPDAKTRNMEVMEMINHGFSKVKYEPFYHYGESYGGFHFENGLPHDVNLLYLKDVGRVLEMNQKVQVINQTFTQTNFQLPLKAKDKLGEVEITFDDHYKRKVDVGIDRNVEKMRFLDYMTMTFWRLLT